jgi:hypothetical protein
LGHELGTKSAEGNVASGGSGAVIVTIVGGSSFHRMSMIVRATPPTRSRTTPTAGVIGNPNNANSPNATRLTGMVVVRLNTIDMGSRFFLVVRMTSLQGGGGPPDRTARRVDFSAAILRILVTRT